MANILLSWTGYKAALEVKLHGQYDKTPGVNDEQPTPTPLLDHSLANSRAVFRPLKGSKTALSDYPAVALPLAFALKRDAPE